MFSKGARKMDKKIKVKKRINYIDVVNNGDKQEIVYRSAKLTNPYYYEERKEEILRMIDEMKNEMINNLRGHINEEVVAELILKGNIPASQIGNLVDVAEDNSSLTIGKQVFPFNSEDCTVLMVSSLDTKEKLYDVAGLERTGKGR